MKINCEYVDFTMEHLETNSNKTKQAEIMIENANDDNGYLLYPDGDPRFAIIYYHGGYMSHSSDLGTEGRQRVRDHYYHGGSQFGSCAGSYMLSTLWQGGQVQKTWFQIWPGGMDGPNTSGKGIQKIINEGSPFIGYLDFEVGSVVNNVMHFNGGSVDTTKMPAGTEICAMHNSSSLKGYAAIWSWKDNDTTGRVLGITGHPEGKSAEDQKRYMGACLLLLADDLGRPDIKHSLLNNKTITMDKETSDNDPLNTKTGDKQYHHFIIVLEKPAKNVTIELDGEDGYDFHLFAAQDTFAFNHSADYADSSTGSDKTLTIDDVVPACTLFVGVKLNTTVTSNQDEICFDRELFIEYSGKLEVLNGIAYTINAKWDMTDVYVQNQLGGIHNQFRVNTAGSNVHIHVGNLTPQSLQVFDARGRLCWNAKVSDAAEYYIWQPHSAGMYLIRTKCGKDILTRRITITH